MNDVARDPDAGFAPAFAAPEGACDAHFHVFGPEWRYPTIRTSFAIVRHEPDGALLRAARRLGFERFVFVQPSAYGMDNSCMLDAMGAMAPALLPRHHSSRRDEGEGCRARGWNALGMRGIRVNVSPAQASPRPA